MSILSKIRLSFSVAELGILQVQVHTSSISQSHKNIHAIPCGLPLWLVSLHINSGFPASWD